MNENYGWLASVATIVLSVIFRQGEVQRIIRAVVRTKDFGKINRRLARIERRMNACICRGKDNESSDGSGISGLVSTDCQHGNGKGEGK